MSCLHSEDTMGRIKTKQGGWEKLFAILAPPLDGSPEAHSLEMVPPTDQTTSMDKLRLILQEIGESRTAMETQLGTLSADISIIRDEHRQLADRVHTTEKTLDTLEPRLNDKVSITLQLRKQVERLQDRAEDAEGRA
ncbi:hypothetical protein NDU88_005979 [Pleurodeles waltl]|uniref:Uncharacterized protein n=1 Tax=Pleurodeles waltl TaxID=8319 RepID=A0AAV7QGB9_PLEWA|nr:hypothetical protein NDU88_005979 [Pleurodeles waltl]